jgi:hypothetical protein
MTIRSKIGLGLVLTFIFGGIVGGAAYRVVLRHRIRGVFQARTSGFMNPFRGEILKQTPPEARPAVEALLAAHGKRLGEIDVRFRGEISAAFEDLFKDLAAHLTAEAIRQVKERLQGPPPRPGAAPGPPGFDGPRPPGPPGGGPGYPGQFRPGGPEGPEGPGGLDPSDRRSPDGAKPPVNI